MHNISKFIERVSLVESRGSRDLILSIAEARQLRDDLAKLLLDLHSNKPQPTQEKIEVQFLGGKW